MVDTRLEMAKFLAVGKLSSRDHIQQSKTWRKNSLSTALYLSMEYEEEDEEETTPCALTDDILIVMVWTKEMPLIWK